MTALRELRLALADKLNDRRRLIETNSSLRAKVSMQRRERDLALTAMKSGVMNFVLDDCADQIVNEIVRRAIEASQVVVSETCDTGDFEIGISVPSFHIRRRIYRKDVPCFAGSERVRDRPIKRINVQMSGT